MSKGLIISLGILGVLVVTAIICGSYFVSTMNSEVGLRNTISAKMQDNESEFDNMFKKISQVAQVSSKQMESLKSVFNEHATARSGKGGQGGTIMTWIQESVPDVDTQVFTNLQNISTSSRERWTMRQKDLIDFKREHDNLLDKFPSNLVCSMLGKEKIEIQIITSTRAKEAMKTGKDDNIEVFEK